MKLSNPGREKKNYIFKKIQGIFFTIIIYYFFFKCNALFFQYKNK